MHAKCFKKSVASFISFLFFISSVTGPMPASASAQTPEASFLANAQSVLKIPAEFGAVSDLSLQENTSAPLLVHLQTAHGHYDAQKNIEAILNYLEKNSDIRLLLLEGAGNKLDSKLYRIFPNEKDFNKIVVAKLVEEGLLTGAEAFLTNGDDQVQGYGVEEAAAYKRNRDDFVTVMTAREIIQAYLNQVYAQIEKVASPYLGKDLKDFLRQEESFQKGVTEFSAWLRFLKNQSARELKLDLMNARFQDEWPLLVRYYRLDEASKKMDASRIPDESKNFLQTLAKLKVKKEMIAEVTSLLSKKELFANPGASLSGQYPSTDRANRYSEVRFVFDRLMSQLPQDFKFGVFPNLRLYIQHLILSSELDSARLYEEINRLTDTLKNKLAVSEKEKAILQIIHEYQMLSKLLSLELSREQYEGSVKGKTGISPDALFDTLNHFNGTKLVKDVDFKGIQTGQINALYGSALDFYEAAINRESIMMEKALRRMKDLNQKKAIMITGGFHAEAMKAAAKRDGLNYVQITPRINQMTKNSKDIYIRSILGTDAVKTSQLEKLLADPAYVQAVTGLPIDLSGAAKVTGGVVRTSKGPRALKAERLAALGRWQSRTATSEPKGAVPVTVGASKAGVVQRAEVRMDATEKEATAAKQAIKTYFSGMWRQEPSWLDDAADPQHLNAIVDIWSTVQELEKIFGGKELSYALKLYVANKIEDVGAQRAIVGTGRGRTTALGGFWTKDPIMAWAKKMALRQKIWEMFDGWNHRNIDLGAGETFKETIGSVTLTITLEKGSAENSGSLSTKIESPLFMKIYEHLTDTEKVEYRELVDVLEDFPGLAILAKDTGSRDPDDAGFGKAFGSSWTGWNGNKYKYASVEVPVTQDGRNIRYRISFHHPLLQAFASVKALEEKIQGPAGALDEPSQRSSVPERVFLRSDLLYLLRDIDRVGTFEGGYRVTWFIFRQTGNVPELSRSEVRGNLGDRGQGIGKDLWTKPYTLNAGEGRAEVRAKKEVTEREIRQNLHELRQWTRFGSEEQSKEFFLLAENTRAGINSLRSQDADKALALIGDLYRVMIYQIEKHQGQGGFKIWTKPQNEVEVELWAATGQVSGLVPGVPMKDMSGRRSQAEIDKDLEGNPEITASQRYADAGGSSIDLRKLQQYLNKLGVTWLDDITSTTVISSQFKVNLKLGKAASHDVIEYVMVSRKWKDGKVVEREEVIRVTKGPDGSLVDADTGKSIFNHNGQIPMKYAFADMMNMFGVWGIRGRFETIDPISEVGGFGRSGASLAMFLDAASKLSGIPLSKADKQAELIFLENERYGGLTGGQETGSTLNGKPVQFAWMEFVRDTLGRFVFGGGTTLNTAVHDPATGMSEADYLNQKVLGAMRMVQPGLEFIQKIKGGQPVLDADGDPVYGPADTRTAGLINTVWTWMLDYADGLLLHLEKTGLANQALFGLRNGLLTLTIRALNRHRVVRNQLDRLYLKVTFAYMRMTPEQKAKLSGAEAEMLNKFVALAEGKSGEDSPILKAYIERFIEESGAGKLAAGQTIAAKIQSMTQEQVNQVASHSLYSLTSESFIQDYIVGFANAIEPRADGQSWKATDKDLPVGVFLVGAGGPGTNIVLVFKNEEIASKFDSYMKGRGFPMFVNKPRGGEGEVGYEDVIRTRTTGGLLRGFMKVDTGKPVEYKNWPAGRLQAETPVMGRYDQTTGQLTVSDSDYSRFAFLPRVRPQSGVFINAAQSLNGYRTQTAQTFEVLAEEGREFVINGTRITVGSIYGQGKVLMESSAETQALGLAVGESITDAASGAVITVKQIFQNVDEGKVKRVILSIAAPAGASVFVQNTNSAFNVVGSARSEVRAGNGETFAMIAAEVMPQIETINAAKRFHAELKAVGQHTVLEVADASVADTHMTIQMDKGFRIVSMVVEGVERCRVPKDLDDLSGGIFLMGPLVNRNDGSQITRDGKTVDIRDLADLSFDGGDKEKGNPIHGIFRVANWKNFKLVEGPNGITVQASTATEDYRDSKLAEAIGKSETTLTWRMNGYEFEGDVETRGERGAIAESGLHPFWTFSDGTTVSAKTWGVFPVTEKKIPTGNPIPVPPEKDFSISNTPLTSAIDNTFMVHHESDDSTVVAWHDPVNGDITVRLTGMYSEGPVHIWGGNDTAYKNVGAIEGVSGVAANHAGRLGKLGGSRLFKDGEVRRGSMVMSFALKTIDQQVETAIRAGVKIEKETRADYKAPYKLSPKPKQGELRTTWYFVEGETPKGAMIRQEVWPNVRGGIDRMRQVKGILLTWNGGENPELLWDDLGTTRTEDFPLHGASTVFVITSKVPVTAEAAYRIFYAVQEQGAGRAEVRGAELPKHVKVAEKDGVISIQFDDKVTLKGQTAYDLARAFLAAKTKDQADTAFGIVVSAVSHQSLAVSIYGETHIISDIQDMAKVAEVFEMVYQARRHYQFPQLAAAELNAPAAIAEGIAWLQKNKYIFGGGFGYDIRINDVDKEWKAAARGAYVMGRTLAAKLINENPGVAVDTLYTFIAADQRRSSDILRFAMLQGFIDEGLTVHTAPANAVTTTGLVSRKALADHAQIAVQVSGSHNLPEANGFKIAYKGLPFYQNDLVAWYEDALQKKGWHEGVQAGQVVTLTNLNAEHVEALSQVIPTYNANAPHAIVDFRNGAATDVFLSLAEAKGYKIVRLNPRAGLTAAQMDEILGAKTPVMIALNTEANSNMNAGIWDPSKDSYGDIEALKAMLAAEAGKRQVASMQFAGIVFDGDGDRAGFLTEKGNTFAPDRMLIAYYHQMLKQNIDGIRALNKLGHTVKLAFDVRASSVIQQVLKDLTAQELKVEGEFIAAGYPNHRTFVKEELEAIEQILREKASQLSPAELAAVKALQLSYVSAEASGHFFFRNLPEADFLDQKIVVDDGVVAAFMMLKMAEGSSIDAINDQYPNLPVTKEVRLEKAPSDVTVKQQLAEDIAIQFAKNHPEVIPMSLEEFQAKIVAARANPPKRQSASEALLLVDGIRIQLKNGAWILFRKSNTSAVIVFKAEAASNFPQDSQNLVWIMRFVQEALNQVVTRPEYQALVLNDFNAETSRVVAAFSPSRAEAREMTPLRNQAGQSLTQFIQGTPFMLEKKYIGEHIPRSDASELVSIEQFFRYLLQPDASGAPYQGLIPQEVIAQYQRAIRGLSEDAVIADKIGFGNNLQTVESVLADLSSQPSLWMNLMRTSDVVLRSKGIVRVRGGIVTEIWGNHNLQAARFEFLVFMHLLERWDFAATSGAVEQSVKAAVRAEVRNETEAVTALEPVYLKLTQQNISAEGTVSAPSANGMLAVVREITEQIVAEPLMRDEIAQKAIMTLLFQKTLADSTLPVPDVPGNTDAALVRSIVQRVSEQGRVLVDVRESVPQDLAALAPVVEFLQADKNVGIVMTVKASESEVKAFEVALRAFYKLRGVNVPDSLVIRVYKNDRELQDAFTQVYNVGVGAKGVVGFVTDEALQSLSANIGQRKSLLRAYADRGTEFARTAALLITADSLLNAALLDQHSFKVVRAADLNPSAWDSLVAGIAVLAQAYRRIAQAA